MLSGAKNMIETTIASTVDIIRKPRGKLGALPPASDVVFPGVYAWSPVSTSALVTALDVDRGTWAVWRNRRIAPAPLPEAWFRRTTGSPLIYRVSDILTWLAARRGEQLTTLDTWRQSLSTGLGEEADTADQVRRLVRLYAEVTGPLVEGVCFTPAGFAAYLNSLGDAW